MRTYNQNYDAAAVEAQAINAVLTQWTCEVVSWWILRLTHKTHGYKLTIDMRDAPRIYRVRPCYQLVATVANARTEVHCSNNLFNREITVTFNRGPEGLAKDIARKLEPELALAWPQFLDRLRVTSENKNKQDAVTNELREIFGHHPSHSNDRPGWVYGKWDIDNIFVSHDGAEARLEIAHTFSIDKIKKIATFFKELATEEGTS